MAQNNDFNALHKEIYGDSLKNLVPEFTTLSEKIKFSEDEATGDKFVQPVQVTLEHGFTYTNNSVVTLNTEIAAEFLEAQVDGKEIILTSAVPYLQAAKMSSSKKAFEKASSLIYTSMLSSAYKRLEIAMLYGNTGLGVVASNTTGALVISAASFAPGIWAGMKGAVLQAFTSGGTQHDGDLTISSVDLTTRTVTVTGTSTAVVANDVLFFKGSRTTDMNGLDKIVTNTGSLYNIDASVYELWKGTSYGAGSAALTLAKILAASAQAAARGCKEELVCVISNATFANLATNEAALRQYDGEGKSSAVNGFSELKFHGPTGPIVVIPSIFCKEGEGFLVPTKKAKRIGSSDVSFKIAGGISTDNIWLHKPDTNAWQLRLYSHQNLFVETPHWCVKITGIVNT